jgi:hypothetical protein
MTFNKDSALKILILIVLVSGGIYLFFHFDFHVFFADRRRLIDFIKSFGPLSVVVFIGLLILQVLFAPVPGEVTVLYVLFSAPLRDRLFHHWPYRRLLAGLRPGPLAGLPLVKRPVTRKP